MQEINSLKQQLTDIKTKNDEKLFSQVEDVRKKLTKEVEACKKELEQNEYARARSDKAKEKLMQVVRLLLSLVILMLLIPKFSNSIKPNFDFIIFVYVLVSMM